MAELPGSRGPYFAEAPRCNAHDEMLPTPGRQLLCREYNACLTVAADHAWPAFTCTGCEAYVRLEAHDEMRDLHGFVNVVCETFGVKGAWAGVTPRRRGPELGKDQ